MPNCKNCGESIELVNYTSGPTWMHNPPGYTGHKMGGGAYNVFRHCRKSVAEPECNCDLPAGVHDDFHAKSCPSALIRT